MAKNRIIELCLVFLISVLSFSVGTFVGKKYSDNQHKLSLLDPHSDKNSENENKDHVAAVESTHETSDASAEHDKKSTEESNPEDKLHTAITQSAPISDSDVAKLAQEFSNEEDSTETSKNETNVVKTIDENGNVVKENTVKTKTPQKNTAHEKTNASQTQREVANIAEKVKTITPDGKAQYTVQVGAFPSATEADKVAGSLQARGYKASHAEATVNGKTWYRVHVGLFNNLEDAQVYKKELVEQNHIQNAIIQRLNK